MKKSPLRRVSKKRAKENKQYLKLKAIFLENHPTCNFTGFWNGKSYTQYFSCTRKSTDIHHKKGRTGTNFLDTGTWMQVCRYHHQLIHDKPKLARASGYILT